jgi:hypothetical protein
MLMVLPVFAQEHQLFRKNSRALYASEIDSLSQPVSARIEWFQSLIDFSFSDGIIYLTDGVAVTSMDAPYDAVEPVLNLRDYNLFFSINSVTVRDGVLFMASDNKIYKTALSPIVIEPVVEKVVDTFQTS